jgi:Uncharacterized protein conserved in bacteria (DUF2330)
MKNSSLLAALLALAFIPAIARADGMFVPQKFVWDKHKDINEPTQKAIIVYDAGREDLILQVKYEGPVDQFGWLIPVPGLPTVELGSMKCFYELSKLTQQRQMDGLWAESKSMSSGIGDESAEAKPEVKVIEIKTVGAYKTAILSANDSGALKKWLDDNHFVLPPDPSGVIDSYIQRHWDFIAVKINLDKSLFHSDSTTSKELASGELNPLQISFATDHCIFPLRISSLNGKPSEVQLYVLASDPLLCQAQYEKDLVIAHSNNLVFIDQFKQRMQESDQRLTKMREERGLPPLIRADDDYPYPSRAITPQATPDELIQFTQAGAKDLPDCTDKIPRLAGKPWWIAKKTWTFHPADMQDLDFGPAIPVFAEMLSSQYGYIAAANLAAIGPDAVPILITMLNNSSPIARANAADTLGRFSNDPRVKAAAPAWFTNSEPQAKVLAIEAIGGYPGSNPGPDFIKELIPLLTNEDREVRSDAASAVRNCPNAKDYALVFHQMLTDTNMMVRMTGLRVIQFAGLPIDRSELVPFLSVPNTYAIGTATAYFRDSHGQYDMSNDQVKLLLQNPHPLGRMIGLRVLAQHGDAESLALAKPFLKDPDVRVRRIAERILRQ